MSEVVSLKQKREEKDKEQQVTPSTQATQADLEAAEKRNKANAERIAKERANANKSVLRSYRIKS